MTSTYDSERWKEARQAALARDRVCQDCGASEDLHVHHIRPVKEHNDPEDAHHVGNLVVLCASCHRKWEGQDARPNLLDAETGLSLSRLVYDISRETLARHYEPPGPWLLYEYFIKHIDEDRFTCDFCFQPLHNSRGNTDHCPKCGRPAKLWRAYDSPPSVDEFHNRVDRLADRLESSVGAVDRDMMHDVADHLWRQDEYYGRIEDVTRVVARQGLKYGYVRDGVRLDYEPDCPILTPTPS